VLSAIGGMIGLARGLFVRKVVGWKLGCRMRYFGSTMLIAFGLAAAVGLVFVSYPARRPRAGPIEALRVE